MYFNVLVCFLRVSESLVQRFYGNENGKSEYSDGDASLATFNKPRSFTVDMKGNVYVADRFNHAIRKIGSSGSYNLFFLYFNSTNLHTF